MLLNEAEQYTWLACGDTGSLAVAQAGSHRSVLHRSGPLHSCRNGQRFSSHLFLHLCHKKNGKFQADSQVDMGLNTLDVHAEFCLLIFTQKNKD